MTLRGSTSKRMCFSSYKKMKNFAEKMMKFKVYVPADPMTTDFTKLNSLAMKELLKVSEQVIG